MPEKLHRCVNDVKGQGKSEDSAWAICNDSVSQEVSNATGINPITIPGVREQDNPSNPITIPGVSESHNPLDIPFGYEVNETHSIGSGLSGTNIKVDNSHSGKKKLDRMSELVVKQLLETQIGECSCKNKNRRKA